MARFRRWRPSPSMIVAFVALFVAGAGSATAARLITGKEIRNSSITSKDVRNGSLLRRDFRSGQLPRGPQGLPGASGRAGRDGFSEIVYASGEVPAPERGHDPLLEVSRPGSCRGGRRLRGEREPNDIVPGAQVVELLLQRAGLVGPQRVGRDHEPCRASQTLIVEAICANASRSSFGARAGKSGPGKAAKPLR